MSLTARPAIQLAERLLRKTPKQPTTKPPGFKPSLGSAIQGAGEFKVYNLNQVAQGEAVFRSLIKKFPGTPAETQTPESKAEQMLQSHDQEIIQRSKDRTKYRQFFREFNRSGTPTSAKTDVPTKPRDDTGRRPTPIHMLPIPGNIPTDPGEEPVIPSLDEPGNIPEEEPVIPTPDVWPGRHEPEEWKTGVYSCEAAEQDAAALGQSVKFCPRATKTISIRALLRGQ